MNKQPKTILAAAAAVFVLTACGGGSGSTPASSPSNSSTSSTSSSTPASSSSAAAAPLATSVPTPTYAAGSVQLLAFQELNGYRTSVGVGELAQDRVLDTSASAHALYELANLSAGTVTALSHDETAGYVDYFQDTPLSRGQKAGAPTTEWIGEVIAAGYPSAGSLSAVQAVAQDCVAQLLDTVYHMSDMLANQQTVGVGFDIGSAGTNYVCTLDFGTTTGVTGSPGPNDMPEDGGQQLASNQIVNSPYAGQQGVALSMVAETPNPAADVTAPGHPLMVRVSAPIVGDILTVTSFTLNGPGGAVAARIIVPSTAVASSTAAVTADPNNLLSQGVVVLLPLSALTANTTYSASFAGARDGTPISTSWSFTTASN